MQRSAVLLFASFAGVFSLLAAASAQGQDVSFSGGLGSSISTSTAQAGLNGSFDASTANLTNPQVRADVSDATHSQLLGSTLSPADLSYANPYLDAAPRTGIQTDAQAAVGANDFAFGGRRSQAFRAGTSQRFGADTAARQGMLGSSGLLSSRAAFAGAMTANAFSGRTSANRGTGLGFSGEGVGLPTVQTGPGATQTLAATGAPDESIGYLATDPVLTGSNSGWETGPELHGDMPSPLSQALGFFTEASGAAPVYEFDDGQTPLQGGPGIPGQILGAPPDAFPAATGFPDSTRGLAGLPTETGSESSPFSRGTTVSVSPFAPVSEGTVYEPKTRLDPSLHANFPEAPRGSFDAFERRVQELRITRGMSISQAAEAKQQDLREFQRTGGRYGRASTVRRQSPGAGGQQPELMRRPVIR